MNTIDWYLPNTQSRVEAKNVQINLSDDIFTIIFMGFDKDEITYLEGKILLQKTLEMQSYEGEITYKNETGIVEKCSFRLLGKFLDDNYDEFSGDWYEGDVFNTFTICLEDIREIV